MINLKPARTERGAMVAVVESAEQSLVLDCISWQTYESLLKDFDGRPLRHTYDEGTLEIMTLSLGHENYNAILGRLVETLSLELDIPIYSGGSATLRRKAKLRGLEADRCYWIANELRMRGKKTFDIRRDPPPDLALEVDITRSVLDRMAVYASLRIPEVWRFTGKALQVYHLTGNKYRLRATSMAFPFLPMAELLRFLLASDSTDETSLVRSFATWIREELLPKHFANQGKRGRRSNGGF